MYENFLHVTISSPQKTRFYKKDHVPKIATNLGPAMILSPPVPDTNAPIGIASPAEVLPAIASAPAAQQQQRAQAAEQGHGGLGDGYQIRRAFRHPEALIKPGRHVLRPCEP
jgi:hypothetical protein